MKVLTSLSLLCIVSLLAVRSEAQIIWQQTRGPEGAAVSAVCVDSINHVLICTKSGGIFESADSGDHWISRNQGLPTLFFRDLEAGSNGYAYALSNGWGMFRMRREDDPSWMQIDTTTHFPSGVGDMAVNATGDLFMATNQYGIMVSHDNGDHFTSMNVGIDSLDLTKVNFPRLLTIATDGQIYTLTTRRVVYTSTDQGQHWSALPKSSAMADPFAFSSIPNGGVLIGDVAGKAFLYTAAAGWREVLKVDTSYIFNFFYNQKTHSTFARYSNGLLFRSSDMGETWETVSDEIEGGEYFPTAVNKYGVIFSGVDYDGMLRSFDDGNDFETINTGLIGSYISILQVDKDNNLYANSNERIYRSSDLGQHWETLALEIHDILMAPVYSIDSANVLYANDNGWIDVSEDSGKTWFRKLETNRPINHRITYALLSTKDQTFAASNQGLYRTVDHGHTWTTVSVIPGSPDTAHIFITLVLGADGAIYVQGNTGEIYKSTDDGHSWSEPFSRSGQLQFVLKNGMMFRYNNERVERSNDGGQNWTTLSVDTAREARSFQLFGVYIDDKGQIFACSDSGVYISKDLGETWITSNEGLKGPYQDKLSGVSSVVKDHLGNYFISSHGQGVFISPASLNAVSSPVHIKAGSLQSYPNPIASQGMLRFTLDAPANVRYEIVDVTGRILFSSASTRMSEGSHDVAVDVSELPNGSYLCTMTTGTDRRNVWLTVSH